MQSTVPQNILYVGWHITPCLSWSEVLPCCIEMIYFVAASLKGFSYLLACSYYAIPGCSRKHDVKSYGLKCYLCQFIATVCEYLLGAMHLLSMLHASLEFTPPRVVEQRSSWGSWRLKHLAVGHSWWVAMPGFLLRPPGQVQESTSNMATEYTVPLAFIAPPSVGQLPSHKKAVKIKPITWYSLMPFSSHGYSVPPINPTLAPQPH